MRQIQRPWCRWQSAPARGRAPQRIYQESVMTDISYRTALIVGPGISASVARGLAAAGLKVGLAARNVEKLAPLATETRAQTFAVDASDPAAVARLFDEADTRLGEPDVVLYNASARAHGPIAELDPEAVRKAIEKSAYGGVLVVQQAARRMSFAACARSHHWPRTFPLPGPALACVSLSRVAISPARSPTSSRTGRAWHGRAGPGGDGGRPGSFRRRMRRADRRRDARGGV